MSNKDQDYAKRIKEECSSGDYEGNGCNLDTILHDLLKELGMEETLASALDVHCWRG